MKTKTILIADENHIDEEAYKEFKEKVISHTIKIAANYSEIIQCIVRDYKETVVGYCTFLEKHQDTIKEIFGESKSDNLRTLKIWLTDFERVYKLWIELDLPLKDIDQVFYNFGAVMFEYKSAQCELDQHGLVEFKSKESTHKKLIFNLNLHQISTSVFPDIGDLLYWRSGLCQVSGMKNL